MERVENIKTASHKAQYDQPQHKTALSSSKEEKKKKKALFPKPQSIDISTKRHARPLLHCDSKQRPKPPDVNSHRNATRRILQ